MLIAGAFSGGWIWSRVANKLRTAGHTVYAPSNTGVADRSHLLSPNVTLDTFVKDIASLIVSEELSDVILVGHSFGGIPVSGAAEMVPSQIKQLVFLDALVVQPGKSAFDGLPPEVVAARRKAAQDTSGGRSLPVPPPAAFGDLGITAMIRLGLAKTAIYTASTGRIRNAALASQPHRQRTASDLHRLHEPSFWPRKPFQSLGQTTAWLEMVRNPDRTSANGNGPGPLGGHAHQGQRIVSPNWRQAMFDKGKSIYPPAIMILQQGNVEVRWLRLEQIARIKIMRKLHPLR